MMFKDEFIDETANEYLQNKKVLKNRFNTFEKYLYYRYTIVQKEKQVDNIGIRSIH